MTVGAVFGVLLAVGFLVLPLIVFVFFPDPSAADLAAGGAP